MLKHFTDFAGIQQLLSDEEKMVCETINQFVMNRVKPTIAEYYAARGWDNGVAPETKLRELGIVG